MALVTVCIPSYRSAAFIGQTLDSVQRQEFTDLRVILALEPDGAAETVAAGRPYFEDTRFSYYVNEQTLGYAGNVRSVLHRVETTYFAVLPHDDLWHPRYLAALMGRLAGRPDASAAFADAYVFGHGSCVRSHDLSEGDLPERLLSFFLAGAPGSAWRGLVRSRHLNREFPINEFNGFAVECEWAMHLLLGGTVLRHAEPLYLKRQASADDADSVSVGWRFRMPEPTLRRALDHHRARLLALLDEADLEETEHRTVALAAEAATLLRWAAFSHARFGLTPGQEHRIASAMEASWMLPPAARRQITGRLHLALSRYHAGRGDHDQAEQHGRAAVHDAPNYGEAVLHLARFLLGRGRTLEALPLVQRASALAPMANGLWALQAECAERLSALYPSPATDQW